MRRFLEKYWTWMFVLLLGPVLEFITYKYHLTTASITPILPYFVAIFFLPPWEAGVGFLISTSYSSILLLESTYQTPVTILIRLLLLFSIFVLIVVVKKHIRKNTIEKVNFRELTELSPVGIILTNSKSIIAYTNKKAAELYQYSSQDMEGQHYSILVPERVRPYSLEVREQFWKDNNPKAIKTLERVPALRKDGTEITVDIQITWLTWGGQKVNRITIIDKTDAINLEEERLKTATLEEAVKLRDRFLTIAAHELKTPIASILLYADIMEQTFKQILNDAHKDQTALVSKAIEIIQRQSNTMARLINQFLDISIIKENRVPLARQWFNLFPFLEEICSISQLQTKKHQIKLKHSSDIKIYADPLRLEQVVINLLNNAIKYSPQGGDIEVNFFAQYNETLAVIEVKDHGLGIPENKRGNLFTKFYRAHEDYVGSGLGLGLYISKQIMIQHGGTISFRCPEEGGTIFTLQLPTSDFHLLNGLSPSPPPSLPSAHNLSY